MTYVAVTLEYNQQSIDLALPMQIPTSLLVEQLQQFLNLSPQDERKFVLAVKVGIVLRRLPPNSTLGDNHIHHGMRLILIEDSQSPDANTNAYLQVADRESIAIRSKKVILGRNAPSSGIFVDIDLSSFVANPKLITRKHAQIEEEEGIFFIEDLGSKNGTRLNQQLLVPHQKYPMRDGDVIQIGKSELQLVFHLR